MIQSARVTVDRLIAATIDELQPSTVLGGILLRMGGPTNEVSRIWVAAEPGVKASVPDGSFIFKARLWVRLEVPSTANGDYEIRVMRSSSQYSAASITHNVVLATETQNGNWPLDEIDASTVDLPFKPTAVPGTTVARDFAIDVTEWWRAIQNKNIRSTSFGFFLEADVLPDYPNGQNAYTLVHAPSDPIVIASGQQEPFIELEFGYPVLNCRALEVTAYGARIEWDESPGADYYVVQISEDNGATWRSLASTGESFLHVRLDPEKQYLARVASGYQNYGLTVDFCPPVSFTTSSLAGTTTVTTVVSGPSYDPYKGLNIYSDSDMALASFLTGTKYARCDWPDAARVSAALAAGIEILPIADYAHGHGATDHAPPTDLAGWLADLQTDLVGAWQSPRAVEIWNEPWLDSFWSPDADPLAYLDLVKAAADAIWSVRPNTLILVSLDTVGSTNTTGTIFWRSNILAADTDKFLTDARIRPTTHNYVENRSPTAVTSQPTWWDLDRYKSAYDDLKAHGHPDPKVWITEYGWQSVDDLGGDEQKQADYITQAMQIFQASGKVERAYCFFLKTTDTRSYNWLHTDNTPKPVCAAVKALVPATSTITTIAGFSIEDMAPAPTLSIDRRKHQVTLNLPTEDFVQNPSVDAWQIARRRGYVSELTGDPSVADVVALVPALAKSWTDRFPLRQKGSYQIRGRIDAENDIYTQWSEAVDTYMADATDFIFRDHLEQPNFVLVLGIAEADDGTRTAAAVETSVGARIPVRGGDSVELNLQYRAHLAITTPDRFAYGFRFYDADGYVVTEERNELDLTLVNNESPGGPISATALAPGGATRAGVFFELVGTTDLNTTVRVERVEFFQRRPELDTGWDYVQVADGDGILPDQRKEMLDQTAFSYDGPGWGPLTAAPPGTAATAPYKQTSLKGDLFTFTTVSQYVDLLMYGVPEDTVIELSRLSDSVALFSSAEDASWIPIVDESLGELHFGKNLMKREDWDDPVGGWEADQPPEFADFLLQSGIIDNTNAGPIAGPRSLRATLRHIGDNNNFSRFAKRGVVFQANRTYKLTFSIQGITTGSRPLRVIFGHSQKSKGAQKKRVYLRDYIEKEIMVDTNLQVVEVLWTPHFDASRVWFVLWNPIEYATSFQVKYDLVSVKKCDGFVLPAAKDFAPITIEIPPWFSAFSSTTYRVKLASGNGSLRPYGIRQDPLNMVDVTMDFATVLTAVTNMRNLTDGELELRSDLAPPTIYHHKKRGVDHTKIRGGLDLRRGKNISVLERSSDPSQVANRVMVIGYGDDRFQLVYEVRSLIDRQGRVPSASFYRHDDQGRPPWHPDWDPYTGGTSEDIYGIRYGKLVDPDIKTTYDAQYRGQIVVEKSAWPVINYQIDVYDLAENATVVEVGDEISFRFRDEDKTSRVIAATTDIGDPRHLVLSLGEDLTTVVDRIERIQKDVEAVLAVVNTTTGAAADA